MYIKLGTSEDDHFVVIEAFRNPLYLYLDVQGHELLIQTMPRTKQKWLERRPDGGWWAGGFGFEFMFSSPRRASPKEVMQEALPA